MNNFEYTQKTAARLPKMTQKALNAGKHP